MIEEKSREDLGFPDSAGFIYLHDGEPIVQLHPWEDGAVTVFWRGETSLSALHKAFDLTVREMSHALNIPGNILNDADVFYGSSIGFHSLPYVIDQGSLLNQHKDFFARAISAVTFARFEIAYRQLGNDSVYPEYPIILWADLVRSKDSEIGFSSVLLPDPAMNLLRSTLREKLSDRDFDRLSELIERHMKFQVQRA